MPDSDSPVFPSIDFSKNAKCAANRIWSPIDFDAIFRELVNGVFAPIFLIIVCSLWSANLFNVNPANSTLSSVSHYFLVYLVPFVNLYFIAKKPNTRPSIAMLASLGLSVGIAAAYAEMFGQLIILFIQSCVQSLQSMGTANWNLSSGTSLIMGSLTVGTVCSLWYLSKTSMSKMAICCVSLGAFLWIAGATGLLFLSGWFSILFAVLFYSLVLFLMLRFVLIPYYCLEFSWQQFQKQVRFWADDKKSAMNFAGICVLIGIASSFIIDSPIEITRLCSRRIAESSSESSRAAVRLLQLFGDQKTLLTASSESYVPRLDMGALILHDDGKIEFSQKAYYRLTGRRVLDDHPPLDLEVDQPLRALNRHFDKTDDLIAEQEINGRLQGLSLVSSHLTQECSKNIPLCFSNWELEFQNSNSEAREARAIIKLPSHSVVSSAKIWMNGEPVQIKIEKKSLATQAYKNTVLTKRDPLLITTAGPDKIFLQCYPVTSSPMKVQLSVVSPVLRKLDSRVPIPQVVDGNFSLPDSSKFWQDSKFNRAIAIQKSDREPSVKHMYIVLDGSVHMKQCLADLKKALWAAPVGRQTSVILASDQVSDLSPLRGAPSSAHFYEMVKGLTEAHFQGGPDNLPFLLRTWKLAKAEPDAALVWVHGPQPYLYGTAKGADVAASFGRENPNQTRFIDCEVLPGPNKISQALEEAYWTSGRLKIESLDPLERLYGLEILLGSGKTGQNFDLRSALVTSHPSSFDEQSARILMLSKLDVDDLLDHGKVVQSLDLSVRNLLLCPVTGGIAIEPDFWNPTAWTGLPRSKPYEAGLDGAVKVFLAHELDYVVSQLNCALSSCNRLNASGQTGSFNPAGAFSNGGTSAGGVASQVAADPFSLSGNDGRPIKMADTLGGCIGALLHVLILAAAAAVLWLVHRKYRLSVKPVERATRCLLLFAVCMAVLYSVQIRDLLLLCFCC